MMASMTAASEEYGFVVSGIDYYVQVHQQLLCMQSDTFKHNDKKLKLVAIIKQNNKKYFMHTEHIMNSNSLFSITESGIFTLFLRLLQK